MVEVEGFADDCWELLWVLLSTVMIGAEADDLEVHVGTLVGGIGVLVVIFELAGLAQAL